MGDHFDPFEIRRRQQAYRARQRRRLLLSVWSAAVTVAGILSALFVGCNRRPPADRPATDAEVMEEMEKRGIATSADWAREFERQGKGTGRPAPKNTNGRPGR